MSESETDAGRVDPVPEHVAAPRSWMLWAVAIASLAVATAGMILALAEARLDRPALRAFLIGWIVVPYAVGGILAWWRRPESRLGPLMLATSLAMAMTPLQWSATPLVHSIGHLLDMVPAALFVHVFLSFPTGRLPTRAERTVVIACYLTTLGLQLLKVVLGVNPDSVLAVWPRPALANLVEGIQLSGLAALLLVGTLLLFLRRWRSGRPARRPSALVVDAFGLALVMLALLYLAGLGSWPGIEVIRNLTFAALGLAPVAFLFALLDARLARGAVAGLLVDLQRQPTVDLQAPLARALRDPSLQLVYWLPELGSWADQRGTPRPAPGPDAHRAVRTIARDGEPLAAVLVDRSFEDEPELLDAVTAAAGIALENGRLRAELRARLQELEGSRIRIVEAGRQERQRLERNLHDGAQQRLVALSVDLAVLGQGAADSPDLQRRLARAKDEVSASLAELRDVARGIYPAVLSNHGLAVALESLVARAAVPVRLQVDRLQRLPEQVAAAAYYVVSEALTNIDKHAGARSATVRVALAGDLVVVEVTDDGVGGADPRGGSGLRGLADRAEAGGGRLTVSSPAGSGTRLRAELPWR